MGVTVQIAAGSVDVTVYGDLLQRFVPKVIRNAREHKGAMNVIEQFIDKPAPTREEAALIDLLAGLIDDFERHAFPVEQVTPLERLQFLLEENGLNEKDIAGLPGGRPKALAVLSGKREIDKKQAVKLGEYFGLPPAFFIF